MNTTIMSPQFADAIARAIELLGSASQQLRDQSRTAEDPADKTDLFGLSLLAFAAAGNAWNFLPDDHGIDVTAVAAEDPLALVARAHDGLLAATSAMDPGEAVGLVLEVGSLRQQLRHHVDRH